MEETLLGHSVTEDRKFSFSAVLLQLRISFLADELRESDKDPAIENSRGAA